MCNIPIIYNQDMDVCDRHTESENTKLVQVWNFYYLWVKGYLTWGERDTIFLCWLLLHHQLSTQPTRGACSAQSHLALPSSESRLSRSEAVTQLTAFSQIPKSSGHASGYDVIHLPSPISYLGILFWHLWMTHPLCVPVNTCVNVAPN